MQSSRRTFLKQAAAVAGASCFSLEAQTSPHLDFPTHPRARLAVTSWPFRAYFRNESHHNAGTLSPSVATIDMQQFPSFIAEKFDIHNINPLLNHFHATDPTYLAAVRESVAKANSHIVDLGLPGRCFATTDAASALRDAQQWIDIAAAVGSPSVRQHLSAKPGKTPDPNAAATNLARLADYAGKHNIVINLENDDPTWEDPWFIVNVIEKVHHPYLRGLPDFGNSAAKYGEEGNEKAVNAMLEHAFNMCHVKDTVQLESKTYHVDLGKLFALARKNNYHGYYSMEFDTSGGDPVAGTTRLIDETLKNLA